MAAASCRSSTRIRSARETGTPPDKRTERLHGRCLLLDPLDCQGQRETEGIAVERPDRVYRDARHGTGTVNPPPLIAGQGKYAGKAGIRSISHSTGLTPGT
jgi:hypothetical protein